MNSLDLGGTWRGTCLFSATETFDFDGTVPGCAIRDLQNAGRLPADLFFGKNADSVAAFENCDYRYTRTFSFAGRTAGAKLVFERIDTYGDVYLNGALVYHSENGNIRHEIPVEEALVQGENTLEVRLYSPVERVKGRPKREGAFTVERLYTRRMQCTYGWDWVARFVTCGLGACRLVTREEDEVVTDNVYIATLDADAECASVRVDIGFAAPYSGRVLTLAVLDPAGEPVCTVRRYCAEDFIRADLDIPAPQLWYPLGYGAQPLYTFVLCDGDRTVYREQFGIRTVKILQLPDPVGSPSYQKCLSIQNRSYDFNESFSGFILKVNGERIFCKGANWVPCEPYSTGDIRARQTALLELCAEAGVNMLRIWGGGAFETPHFYSECSRLGITVTQDFLMACGAYPEEEDWFIAELQKEALYAARLIRNQPCLMWWSGDNENAVEGCDTDENYRGRRSAYHGIAPILYREDPYRRFLPSSPFGGNRYASNTVGTTHNTQYLGETFRYLAREDLSDYKDELKKYRARFIAEEPQMGAAPAVSLRHFMTEEEIVGDDDMWLYHTKGNPGLPEELLTYMQWFAEKVLGRFTDGYDRLCKLRYLQYEWLRVVMEQARREKPFCSGIIFWMMNDCWPAAAGWSLIDYYGIPKDAYYAFKRCARPVIASLDREDGVCRVYLASDSTEDEPVSGRVSLLAADGKTVKQVWSFAGTALPGRAVEALTIAPPKEGELLVCDIQSAHGTDRAFYKEGDLALRPAAVTLREEAPHTVTVTADTYVHAVMLSGEAVFEDNGFSLMPGEVRTVAYRAVGTEPVSITADVYTLACQAVETIV